MTAITEKLKNLAAVTAPKENQSVDAAAREMIDKVLGDILSISKKEDLESVPKALQAFAFEKIEYLMDARQSVGPGSDLFDDILV